MPVQRIDYAEAAVLLRAGRTQQEVADRFGVSQPAVNRAIWRGRIKGVSYDRTEMGQSFIPWRPLLAQHRSKYPAKMLRAAARRARGQASAPVTAAQLNQFLRSLDAHGAVVHYDPETPEGFFYVPRRVGIDIGLIRNPYLDDDGRPIANPVGVGQRKGRP